MNLKYEYGLPNRLTGKSFADASKDIEKIFKNRLSSIDIRTKQTLMSRLKDVQENERQKQENITQYRSINQMANGDPDWPESNTPLYEEDASQNHEIVNPYAGNIKPNWFKKQMSPDSWLMRNDRNNLDTTLGIAGVAASILGPMISNRRAMKSLQKSDTYVPELLNEQQYQPNLVNRQQLLRNLSEQASTQKYNLSQTGGNYSQYAQGMANLNSTLLGTAGNLMLQSDLADAQERARIQGLRSNIQQFNIGQKDRAYDINQQNSAAYYNQLAAYKQAQGANIGAVGQSLFNLMQAKKYGKEMGRIGILKGQ
jgi:hypothetical protein